MNPVDTITLLNRLIVTAKNSEATLRAAADEVFHRELQDSLAEYSQFFAHTARELQLVIETLGGRPKGTHSFDNTLHRTWLHVKANISGRNEGLILDSIETDEAEADARFEDALGWDMPPAVREILERRSAGCHERHAHIRTLRAHLPH